MSNLPWISSEPFVAAVDVATLCVIAYLIYWKAVNDFSDHAGVALTLIAIGMIGTIWWLWQHYMYGGAVAGVASTLWALKDLGIFILLLGRAIVQSRRKRRHRGMSA